MKIRKLDPQGILYFVGFKFGFSSDKKKAAKYCQSSAEIVLAVLAQDFPDAKLEVFE